MIRPLCGFQPWKMQFLRCDRGRRRACRHRGRARRRAHGLPHAAADAQHRNAWADVLQSLDRRHRQRAPGQGSRRARRRHGDGDRRGGHPVPDPELAAKARRCARRARRPIACSTGRRSARRLENQPNLHDLPAGGRRPDGSRATASPASSRRSACVFRRARSC